MSESSPQQPAPSQSIGDNNGTPSYNTTLYTITLPPQFKSELISSTKFTPQTPPPLDYTSPNALSEAFATLPLPSDAFFNAISPFLSKPAELLQNNQTVAFPTETVYGLGANACDTDAVGKIYTAKGRPSDNPLIVHIATLDQFVNLTPQPISPLAVALIHHFWPGPLSIILPHAGTVSSKVTAGLTSLAIRMPNHPIALALIKQADHPIAAPSSNLSGKPSPTTAQHVMYDLMGRIPAVVDGFVGIDGKDDGEQNEKNNQEKNEKSGQEKNEQNQKNQKNEQEKIDLNCTFGLESTVIDISHLPLDYDYKTLFENVKRENNNNTKNNENEKNDEKNDQNEKIDEKNKISNLPKQPLIYILRPGAITKAMLEKIVGVGYVEYDPSLLINVESFDDFDQIDEISTISEQKFEQNSEKNSEKNFEKKSENCENCENIDETTTSNLDQIPPHSTNPSTTTTNITTDQTSSVNTLALEVQVPAKKQQNLHCRGAVAAAVATTTTPKHTQYDTKNHGLQPKSPGMKYTHYAPKAPVYIATKTDILIENLITALTNLTNTKAKQGIVKSHHDGDVNGNDDIENIDCGGGDDDDINNNNNNLNDKNNENNNNNNNNLNNTNNNNNTSISHDLTPKIGLLCTTETHNAILTHLHQSNIDTTNLIVKICGSKDDMWSVATRLYGCLRDFDQIDEVEVIFAEIYGHAELGAAIMDRLLKAAGGKLLR